jgi:hypothetical protein
VEVEEVLQALLAHAAALTATLKAALQLLEDNSKQEQASAEAAAAAAAAAGPEQLQAELDRLAAHVAALRGAAAAARAPFGWEDGPLVVAMRRGQLLLVDELNLAEDAVLERLNRCGWLAFPAPASRCCSQSAVACTHVLAEIQLIRLPPAFHDLQVHDPQDNKPTPCCHLGAAGLVHLTVVVDLLS